MSSQLSYPEWHRRYEQLRGPDDPAMIAALTQQLMSFDYMYGADGKRAYAVAHLAWLITPPHYRQHIPYLLGHLILWLYGIDTVLDTCQQMETAYDLHTVAYYASRNPDVELTPPVLASLDLKTDVTKIEPGAGCSVLTLGHGASQLMRDIRDNYPDSAGLERFVYEFEREVWAEVTETLWRLKGDWQQRKIDEYITVGAASIGAIVVIALTLLARPECFPNWEQLHPAIWQAAIICRLANDIATVDRDRTESRANALFLASLDEAQAKDGTQTLLATVTKRLQAELSILPQNETTTYLAYVLNSLAAVALVMYEREDFVPPS